jgi:glycosyltransferase involved in cell wall biosynthesis
VTPIQTAVEDCLAVVVPSLGEGFGMVALEAMERARAVIAASIGGLEDLVREGETGLLVAPGDADGLAAAMLRIANDPEAALAMGREGRRRAIERFPEDRCTERTEQVYDFWLDVRRPDRLDATASNGSRESAAAASTASRKSQATR